jgi:hypothetical protein
LRVLSTARSPIVIARRPSFLFVAGACMSLMTVG